MNQKDYQLSDNTSLRLSIKPQIDEEEQFQRNSLDYMSSIPELFEYDDLEFYKADFDSAAF